MAASPYYDRRRVLAPGEIKTLGFDATPNLGAGETFTSAGTFSLDPSTSDVTLGTPAINVASFLNDDGVTVEIGKGVQLTVTVSSTAADANYEIEGFADTSDGDTMAIRGGINIRG